MKDAKLSKSRANFEKLLIDLDSATSTTAGFERSLYHLLKANEKHILRWGGIEDGYSFHKMFRQIDVTDSAAMDMAIWTALHESEVFWETLDKTLKEVV